MAVRRSREMWLAAYFLSRCGQHRENRRTPMPPAQLEVGTWDEAYALFHPRLHGGRELAVFCHTMKHARDTFDGHHDSGRIGWREAEAERPPRPLGQHPAEVMAEWQDRTDPELWRAVQLHIDPRTRGATLARTEELASEA